MTALSYLFLTKWKNRFKLFIKKPANWIITLFFIALLALVLWAGAQGEAASFRPLGEVFAMVSALYIILFLMMVYQGLSRGVTLFSMADVQHLFTAPLQPRQVLHYGLFQQMGTSLMVGFFILFQYGWLRQSYAVTMGSLAVILVGYAITIFMGQFAAMVLYPWAAGHAKRRNSARAVLFGLAALTAAWVIVPTLMNPQENWLAALAIHADSWAVYLFPIGGWMSLAVKSLLTGQASAALIALGGCCGVFALLTAIAQRSGSDFYEDVLGATQRGYQALAAQKEGQVREIIPEDVKVGKTGLGGGWGASAFYYKHRLESRRGRRFLFDTVTLIMMVASWVFGYFMRESSPYFILGFGAYMQLFSIGMGRWVRELAKPTAYLIPEGPFKKLLWLMMESFGQYFLEAVVFTLPIAWYMHLEPLATLGFILARFSFSLLYMAGNMVEEQLLGGLRARMLVLMIYIVIMLVMMAPAIVLTALFAASLPMGLGILGLTNLGVALLSLFLCRNVMSRVEMNG